MQEKKDMFKHFSSDYCLTCRYLDAKKRYCSIKKEERKTSDNSCDKWRYFA